MALETKAGAGSPSLMRISTRRISPRRRFEFWRSLHSHVDLDIPDRTRRGDYRAELLRCVGSDGAEFGYSTSDDTIARFSRPGGEFVMIAMTLSGTVKLRLEDDTERVVAPASGLSVIDGARRLTTATKDHTHVYLAMPRARVLDVLRANDASLGAGFLSLQRRGLTPFLEAQLQTIASVGEQLDARSMAIALKVTQDLALGALAQALPSGSGIEGDEHVDAIFAAACRYIDVNSGRKDLTAASIAHALGYSRASLFRVFGKYGTTIGDRIEAFRFDRAAHLLCSGERLSVEQVALRCGFSSGSSFARAFRRRHGMTPMDFRSRDR